MKDATMSRLELAAILRDKAWRNYLGVFAAPETRQERTAKAVQARHRTNSFGQLVPIEPAAIASRLFDTRRRPTKQTKHEWPPGDTPLAHTPNRLHRTPDLTEIQMSAPQTA